MSDPWDGNTQAWGPGPIEDFAKLTGQRECSAIEAFDIFIRRNVNTNMHGHLLDNDDNDGQAVRNHIWLLEDALDRVRTLADEWASAGGWAKTFGEAVQRALKAPEE